MRVALDEADLIVRCGTVVSAGGGRCHVTMERDRCPGCAGRCAVGLGWPAAVVLEVAAAPLPGVGERVFVGVARRGMTAAALTVFGLPLGGLAAGAWLAPGGGWWALGFAVGGILAWALGRRRQQAAWLRPRLVAGPRPPPSPAA